METKKHFKVDTTRHHSRSKVQAQWRHVFGIMTFMFPLGALFIWLMALLGQSPLSRGRLYAAALWCLAGGVVSSLVWGMLVALKNHRHAATHRDREEQRRQRAEALQRERERLAALNAQPDAPGGAGADGPRP